MGNRALEPRKAREMTVERKAEESLFTDDGERILRVQVDPGIGDFSWAYSKLCCLDMPLHIVLPDTWPRRTGPLMDLLPPVVSWEYKQPKNKGRFLPCAIGGLAFRDVSMEDFKAFVEKEDYYIWMSLNQHLEEGQRIENYFPECGTDYHYEIKTPEDAKAKAKELTGDEPYLLIYTSSYKANKIWRGWQQEDWRNFVNLFRNEFGDIKNVIIGAGWDTDYKDRFKIHNTVNLVGDTPLEVTIEIIRNASYFVAFPSGLPVLSTVVNSPCWMFYPKHLEPMHWTWADPEDIKNKRYMASQWCPPEDVVKWLKDEYKFEIGKDQ